MTMSININKQVYNDPAAEGDNQANVQLEVVSNPNAGPTGGSSG
ncbi:MAG: hypothetical protein AAB922_05975 [Patescibacteria group bacterium]